MRTIAGVCHYALSPPIRPGAPEPGVPRASSPRRQGGGRVNQARLRPDAAPMLRGHADYAQRTPVRRGPVPRTAKMRYPMGAPGRGLPRDLDPSGQLRASDGRLAQRESASFTPRRSLVRSQYRPQMFGQFRGSTDSSHPIRGMGAVAVLGGIWEIVFSRTSCRTASMPTATARQSTRLRTCAGRLAEIASDLRQSGQGGHSETHGADPHAGRGRSGIVDRGRFAL